MGTVHPRASTCATNAATAFIAIGIIATAVISSASIGIAIIVIATKVEPKSVPGEAPGHLKSTQNRSRKPFGPPGGDQQCSGSDSGASRDVPASSREGPETLQRRTRTPKRASRSVRGHAEATKIDVQSHPGASKSFFFHVTHARCITGSILRRSWSIFDCDANSVNP